MKYRATTRSSLASKHDCFRVLLGERREGQENGLLLKSTQLKARYGYCNKNRVQR
jgi:hypothetical protein